MTEPPPEVVSKSKYATNGRSPRSLKSSSKNYQVLIFQLINCTWYFWASFWVIFKKVSRFSRFLRQKIQTTMTLIGIGMFKWFVFSCAQCCLKCYVNRICKVAVYRFAVLFYWKIYNVNRSIVIFQFIIACFFWQFWNLKISW